MFKTLSLPRFASPLHLFTGASLLLVSLVCLLAAVGARAEAAPTVPVYGEVGHFPSTGGPAAAEYGETTTAKVPAGAFVDPLGMVVDVGDSSAPDGNAIYVLDNVNPQALNVASPASLKLEYRIQKLGEHGELLGSREFSLQSTVSEPGLHAVSLAVDGSSNRVYVLIADSIEGKSVVDRIDAWTAGRKGEAPLAPAVGLTTEDNLVEDKASGAGELAGPATTHHLQSSGPGYNHDIEGQSLAVDGTGADLALGGNEYAETGVLSSEGTVPVIELLKTSGAAGAIDGQWRKAGETEDQAAKEWSQKSEELYSLSTNPDGSLNVALGPIEVNTLGADLEPNMAEVSADLASTRAVLPSTSAGEGSAQSSPNRDLAATDGFSADAPFQETLEPSGATREAGVLAPSLIRLEGEEAYAGLVVNRPIADQQNPAGAVYSWHAAAFAEGGTPETRSITPSSLAIRLFDAGGDSLGMIGNVTGGGPCNLRGGSSLYGGGFSTFGSHGSFLALARGTNGVLFALVQSELANTSESGPAIAPGSSVATGTGDQIVEFAPGAGQNGAAGQQCPQPTGAFSITDETPKGASPSTGSGPVTVAAGTTLEFDASEVNLQGGSPWAYDWDLANGASPGKIDRPWTVDNKFSALPGGEPWQWSSPTVEFKYDTPGSYTTKLSLVNDFGTFDAQRIVNVVKAEPITGVKIAVSGALTAGQAVSFTGSGKLPQFDSVVDYHWDFGDGQGDDQPTSGQDQHVYAAAGSYTVKLTITDALGHRAEASEAVTIAPASVGGGGVGGGGGTVQTGGGGGGGGTNSGPVIQTKGATSTNSPKAVPTKAQELSKALKACKRIKSKKRRASCERQAKNRYASKAGKGKHKHKRPR